ncbi:hypothetical protein [Paraburkholderia sacchari]|uniref:hypothetical protein n=1 Tax=Paraburkholderia sacchari TaxID=159450 RepID=UPI003D97A3B5
MPPGNGWKGIKSLLKPIQCRSAAGACGSLAKASSINAQGHVSGYFFLAANVKDQQIGKKVAEVNVKKRSSLSYNYNLNVRWLHLPRMGIIV